MNIYANVEPTYTWQPLVGLWAPERFPVARNDMDPTTSPHIWDSPQYIIHHNEQVH
jgi:hypothetical protein